ncbi:hypothetical protein DH2020_039206 [Rehmannia glutinosa]|uniref:AAA+ ATPase domain-containing protein n=1 Tax=Rehmannia glutinosa TaxID=99300 RepID=A0ABR0UYA3_REHGL
MKDVWTTMASIMGVWAFFQTLLHTVFPPELRFAALKFLHRLTTYFSSYCYYDITEVDGVNTNELYNAVQLYLSSSASISGTRLSLTRGLNSSAITFGLSNNDRLIDFYKGITVEWEHIVTQRQGQTFSWRPLPDEKRGFTLRVRKNNKHLVLNSYLDFVMEKANELRRRSQDRLLYTNSRGHPWSLCRLSIRGGLGKGVFIVRSPGTGKSSMIAAMANYLGYDIYDLELSEVNTNSELRKLLMKTSSKSIIVIEDIDCSINLTNRNRNGYGGGNTYTRSNSYGVAASTPAANGGDDGGNTITLSGLLNFTDGLWSCCGSERIFVFTTNHIEKLDPALLRSGRMDMHINMSYCNFPALKILLRNYLGYDEECDLEKELEEFVGAAEMTPADISEVLIKHRRDKNKAVGELVVVLKLTADERKRVKSTVGNGSHEVEDEEQEKRALDSPKEENENDELQENCHDCEEKDGYHVEHGDEEIK